MITGIVIATVRPMGIAGNAKNDEKLTNVAMRSRRRRLERIP